MTSPSAQPKPPTASVVLPTLFRTCQWPLTNGRPWRFCDAPVVLGSAWCEAHYRTVYARPPRQERAA